MQLRHLELIFYFNLKIMKWLIEMMVMKWMIDDISHSAFSECSYSVPKLVWHIKILCCFYIAERIVAYKMKFLQLCFMIPLLWKIFF